MEWVSGWPVGGVALLIFGLRALDVSLGTLRTISVVQGQQALSIGLGFFEVMVWVIGVSQVITGLQQSPILLLAYAAGFASGNGVGIAIERRLAMGSVVIRMVSARAGNEIAACLRRQGQRLTTFEGEGRDGPVTLLYIMCCRRDVPKLIAFARSHDPNLFYTVEPLREWSSGMPVPLPHATGWRAAFQKK